VLRARNGLAAAGAADTRDSGEAAELAKVPMAPCPKCGDTAVCMAPAYGGRGTRDSTAYIGECAGCGYRMEELPSNGDGRKSTAIAEWNRVCRQMGKGENR
jgi:hypothetical protein